MAGLVQVAVITLGTVMMVHQCSSTDVSPESMTLSNKSASEPAENNTRDKRVAEPMTPMESGRMVRKKKAHDSGTDEDQLRALNEFLKQTRQLGVADSEALALLDKELANAQLPSLKASLGSALPSRESPRPHPHPHPHPRHRPSQSLSQRPSPMMPVYHATPLMPYGALHVPNAQPYEKRMPIATPIKEEQHDTPAPKRPLVVDLPAPEHSSAQTALSPEQLVALQSPGKVTEAIPIRAETPMELDRRKPTVKLFQPAVGVGGSLPHGGAYSPLSQASSSLEHIKTATATVQGQGQATPLHYGASEEEYASRYRFGYRIRDPHSGSDFGHSEAREGEHTQGGYHVLLPDGRLQSVRYWAGPSGFHASVSYSGEATYAQSHSHQHQ